MVDAPVKEQIISELNELEQGQLEELLDFAIKLKQQRQHRGALGKELMHFVGSISPEDLDAMARAIEEDCERIDPETWDIELL